MSLSCFRLRGSEICASCGEKALKHWWDDTVGVSCDVGGVVCWPGATEARVPTRADLDDERGPA